MFEQPVETITIVTGFLEGRISYRRRIYKESKVQSYCNFLSIEKYLDGGVEILSLGRFLFFFFFFFVIKSLLCLKVQKTHAALAMEIKNL